ncbi:lipoprotein-releasing system ATP-binding protein LolD 1 [Iodidimonas gelatinilytica]|nr:ABC transporter ATP-binding protein [Iodidimonas gelatinilytica]GEQ96709.1 lipoprotein-releasing system ATP-binding protein LolD 1 [Iodidimonas gelatinilytica]
MGQSGAGKSTLLHIAGLLERPSSGAVYIADQSLADASERNRTRVRLDALGFVYQFHHLLPEFSAIENVAMPLIIAGSGPKAANMRASELLERLGLGDRLTHRPAQLSGGEQQRVAIARALANRPAVLLADEPTGNLDEDTAGRVMNELVDVAREHNLAALVATHNPGLAERMDRTLTIRGGKLV